MTIDVEIIETIQELVSDNDEVSESILHKHDMLTPASINSYV